ncbi:glycosyltransferase family 9 protein [Desulfuromonas acetoxidans]|uniref:glycosyltransferase family 9 protein n=1 Tax=Desulfuromonas acetoxidans TaxID=891 RepID=UPI00138A0748|nr:glycosyltransferase family 9 protein [Desulfuromonas acetoxidans]MBF0644777.1 glycosyltransferase family 9 protein [Desulfuromonas acetoxidans]NVD23705.1 glycosyltransferase family 9 protein [Desulfuromonas acetoxidans]NVE15910.1 glycosyltransferase family 9 protein [Desulfuromonas acetoxidans]
MNQISFLKKLDGLVGPLLVWLLGLLPVRSTSWSAIHCRSILIVRPGGIGDAVLLLPTLQACRDFFEGASIYILAEKRNAQVFDLCEGVAEVWCYDKLGDWKDFFFKDYDLIIDTEQSHYLSAVISKLLRAGRRCGFASNKRRLLFDCVSAYDQKSYEVESFLSLLDSLEVPRPTSVQAPFISAQNLCGSSLGCLTSVIPQTPYVVLFPGASVADKRWPVERWAQLAVALRGMDCQVVVVGGHQDLESASLVAKRCGGISIAGKTSLPQVARVISEGKLFVGADSGLLHLAVAVGSRTVALFGPSSIDKWAPRGSGHRVVSLGLPCSPCSRFGTIPPCLIEYRCVQDISVSRVFEACKEGLLRGEHGTVCG